jgi:tetratricopeptide (TPR) repeat protein
MDDEERRPSGDENATSHDGPASPHDEAYDLFRRGQAFLRQDHPGQAVIFFERARRLAPGKNSIREALGRAYFQLGCYDRAAAEFSAIVERVPTNDYARYAFGRALLKLGRFAEARGQLRLALAMSPTNHSYRSALERCLAEERRAAETGR